MQEIRVIDIVTLNGETMAGIHPYERYQKLLQGCQQEWFMPKDAVNVQWVGNISAIGPIFNGGMSLPHKPLYPLCLTTEDPLKMVKPKMEHIP